jgi:hypothetical protein
MKHQMKGATQAQLGTTLRITLMCNCYFPDFILFYLAFIFFKSISVLLSPIWPDSAIKKMKVKIVLASFYIFGYLY